MHRQDNEHDDQTSITDHIRTATFYTGLGLVVVGVICLLYLIVTLIQIINAPDQSGLVQWLVRAVSEKDLVLSGHAAEAKFELHASETLQYFFFGIIGFIMIRILISIVNAFITGGIRLIMLANPERKQHAETKATNSTRPHTP
ncbi:MAG: hypothetical protein OEZ39_19345 [Gammaproteobacteria bacterium]|nr:hypothetical protein [Gammaproteobacteria bacterium]MDH5654021.1 hypothetical protein [Gammaproteobacteria bacterium]